MMKRLCLLVVSLHFTEGCILSGVDKTNKVKGHTGGSVLLPCSCADMKTKPQSLIWRTLGSRNWTEMFSDERYRGRVKGFTELSPGNLSLLITDLREEDERGYRCETGSEQGYYRDFTLSVSDVPSDVPSDVSPGPPRSPFPTSSSDLQTNHDWHLALGIVTILVLLGLCVGALFCWRGRAKRSGQNVGISGDHPDLSRKQQDQSGSDVTYTTIDHRNAVPSAHIHLSTGRIEYATVKAR